MMVILTTVIVWWYHNQGRRLPARACTALDLGTVWELDSKWAWWLEEGGWWWWQWWPRRRITFMMVINDKGRRTFWKSSVLPFLKQFFFNTLCQTSLPNTLSQTIRLQYSLLDKSSSIIFARQVFCITLCQTCSLQYSLPDKCSSSIHFARQA